MRFTSPAAVAAQIAQLEERLGTLRRLQGAMAGGHAGGSARQHRHRDEQIRSYYLQRKGDYGVVKEIAATSGLSERQVRRILRIGGVKRDTVADILSRDPPASRYSKPPSKPARAASRSADRGIGTAPRAAISAEPESPQPDDTDDPVAISPEQFFDGAGILIKSMYRQANEARIPGDPQIDREAALQLIESLADEWHDLITKLWRRLGSKRRRSRNRKSGPLQPRKRTRTY